MLQVKVNNSLRLTDHHPLITQYLGTSVQALVQLGGFITPKSTQDNSRTIARLELV